MVKHIICGPSRLACLYLHRGKRQINRIARDGIFPVEKCTVRIIQGGVHLIDLIEKIVINFQISVPVQQIIIDVVASGRIGVKFHLVYIVFHRFNQIVANRFLQDSVA